MIVCFPGAEEVRKNRIHEVHSSAAKGDVNGDVNLEDAKIGLPDIRDIPQVLKCVCLIYVHSAVRLDFRHREKILQHNI